MFFPIPSDEASPSVEAGSFPAVVESDVFLRARRCRGALVKEVEGIGSPGGVGVEDAFPSATEGRGGGDCSAVVDPSFGFRVLRFRGGTGSAGDADAGNDSSSAAEAGGGGPGISGGFLLSSWRHGSECQEWLLWGVACLFIDTHCTVWFTKTIVSVLMYSADMRRLASQKLWKGHGIRATADALEVSPSTIWRWKNTSTPHRTSAPHIRAVRSHIGPHGIHTSGA